VISKGPLNTALNLAFLAGLFASAAVVVLFALPVSPPAIVFGLSLFSCAAWALRGADFYANRGIEQKLRGVVGDRSRARSAPTALHGESVEQRRHERAQDAGDDAELGALRTTERDKNDDADQRREGESGDHDDAEKVG